MDKIVKRVEEVSKRIDVKTLRPIAMTLVVLSIVYSFDKYSVSAALKTVLANDLGRFIVFTFAAYVVTNNPVYAITVGAIAVAVFLMVDKLTTPIDNFEIIKTEATTHQGCVEITVNDLLTYFEGDEKTLKEAMFNAGVPLNLELSDENAPRIATHLINNKHKINAECRLNC